MDAPNVEWSEERYNNIISETSLFLKKIGFNPNNINYIPISGWLGDNLIEKSKNLQWYKGPTVIEALDSIIPPKRPIGKPLRIAISDVFSIKGIGVIASGRVATGVLKSGMNV